MPADFGDSLSEIFAAETNTFLESIEKILLDNENNKEGLKESVPEIFRIMHTIKSSAAMMSLDSISRMAHSIEDLFFFIRENASAVVDYNTLTDIVLDCVDYIKRNLNGNDEDPTEKITFIKAFLQRLKNGSPEMETLGSETSYTETVETDGTADEPDSLPEPVTSEQIQSEVSDSFKFTVFFKPDCQMVSLRAFDLQTRIGKLSQSITTYPETLDEHSESIIKESGFYLNITSSVPYDEIKEVVNRYPFVEKIMEENTQAPAAQPQPPQVTEGEASSVPVKAPENTAAASESADSTFPTVDRRATSRTANTGPVASVSVGKLDKLMDLIGEIIIAEMRLTNDIETMSHQNLVKSNLSLKKMILDLQSIVLSTRTTPIREAFDKMYRIVRDMNRKLGKDASLTIAGGETEVDKSIIDAISAPLMHIVRNSIDHGIETSEERQALGKPAKSSVRMSAITEGRDVIITISDDGKGFDKEKIINKALSLNILTEEKADTLSDKEIYSLVFLPGFSTSSDVTEFSGRGVGMDIVSENVKKLGGSVSANSTPGAGSQVILKIPLTLSIIDAFIVQTGDSVCVLPLTSVKELFRVTDIGSIRNVNGRDTVMMRGECYEIINLNSFFKGNNSSLFRQDKSVYQGGVMISVKNDYGNCVFFADKVLDRQSVVVKPVPELFSGIKGISGCTVLGDGNIRLILNINEIIEAETGEDAK